MGEPVHNIYKLFDVDKLRENINTITNFSLKSPGERASAVIESSVRDEGLRQEVGKIRKENCTRIVKSKKHHKAHS